MPLSVIALGFAPSQGKAGVDECLAFKEKLRAAVGVRDPDGAFLQTVIEEGRRGIQVVFDPEIEGASAWASRAGMAAEGVWGAIRRQSNKRAVG